MAEEQDEDVQKLKNKIINKSKIIINNNNNNNNNNNKEDKNDKNDDKNDGKKFDELGVEIDSQIIKAANEMGWKYATAIQVAAIPAAVAGRDVIGLAQTGSGKTGAFVIPILQQLLKDRQRLYACILAPTRELAIQIHEQVEALGSFIDVKSTVVVGGIDMMTQQRSLALKPHFIVCTPGRLVDHLENTKGFSLRSIKYLVMDEADRMLSMDFGEDVEKILKHCPKERHTYLFSATMTKTVEKLQRASLVNPVSVSVSESKYSTVDTLIQKMIFIPAAQKDVYLAYLINELAGASIMIFVSRCQQCQRLSYFLRALGFHAIPLNGQMSQAKRIASLSNFKSGNRNILIATDVASRGLDIPSVDAVFNYDIPTNPKDYIHRVGRTARAGRSGQAVNFVTQYDVELFQRIETLINIRMDKFPLEESDVMLLMQRSTEAQREAALKLRESSESDRRKGKKRTVENDQEEADVSGMVTSTAHPSSSSKNNSKNNNNNNNKNSHSNNNNKKFKKH